MPDPHDRIIDELMEQLVEQGPGGMAAVFTRLFNLAMRFERENYLSARHYERTDERRGYANGRRASTIRPLRFSMSKWPINDSFASLPRPLRYSRASGSVVDAWV